MEKTKTLLLLGLVGGLGSGGFLGWHASGLTLALTTLVALIFWMRIAHNTEDGKENGEALNYAAFVVTLIVATAWLVAGIIRPIFTLMSGGKIRIALDLFIR